MILLTFLCWTLGVESRTSSQCINCYCMVLCACDMHSITLVVSYITIRDHPSKHVAAKLLPTTIYMVMSFSWNWSGWPYRFFLINIVNALFLSMQFYGCTFLTKLHPVLLSRQDRKLQETSTRNIGNFWHNTNYEGHYKTALWNTDQRFILLTDTAKEVCKFKWEIHRKTNRHQDNSCLLALE